MITVEDFLEKLLILCGADFNKTAAPHNLITDSWDQKFIINVAEHTLAGNAISTTQAAVVLKLIARYSKELIDEGAYEANIISVLQMPTYRRPPYQSADIPREVRYMGDDQLVFRCKFNQNIMQDLKNLKGLNQFSGIKNPRFDKEYKLWVVDITNANWVETMNFIKRHKFSFDDEVANYFMEVSNAVLQPSEVFVDGDEIKIVVKDDNLLSVFVNGIRTIEE